MNDRVSSESLSQTIKALSYEGCEFPCPFDHVTPDFVLQLALDLQDARVRRHSTFYLEKCVDMSNAPINEIRAAKEELATLREAKELMDLAQNQGWEVRHYPTKGLWKIFLDGNQIAKGDTLIDAIRALRGKSRD